MSRLTNALLFLVVTIILFHLTGVLEDAPSGTGYVLNNLGITNPENIGTTQFWQAIVAVGAITAAGIIVGSRVAGSFQAAFFTGAIAPMIAISILIIQDFFIVGGLLYDINKGLAVLVMGPLIFYIGFSVIDWARGRDTR